MILYPPRGALTQIEQRDPSMASVLMTAAFPPTRSVSRLYRGGWTAFAERLDRTGQG
jgi:hypothetical protein